MLLSSNGKYALTRWIFLRFLGVVYALAFWSLSLQLLGLLGKDGILPAHSFLEILSKQLGLERFWLFPTLAWINASDASLQILCNTGIILSLSVVLGILSGPALLFLWLLYLSFVTIGGDFLSFQWDVLLLETGFLSIFLAPWQLVEFPLQQKLTAPPTIVIWLIRLLLFRLMFESGIVKLASGDPTWSNLTALTYHYFSQPLPTPVAWYAAQLPDWFQRLSVLAVFIIELVLPFFIFAPRRLRIASGIALITFQVLISTTGNYAFFNLLTITLCLMLLDDDLFKIIMPKSWSARLAEIYQQPSKTSVLLRGITVALAIFIGTLTVSTIIGRTNMSAIVEVILEPIEHFYCVNSYGLFAVMTTSRLEIIVEGSDDGRQWLPYQFEYKPGSLNLPPQWVAPYQPRLDWQMWFASLSDYRSNIWFLNFACRLLQGSQPVLSLLETNPFPTSPPRYVRAELYRYRFTDFATKNKTGNWWQREYVGHYLPPIHLTLPYQN